LSVSEDELLEHIAAAPGDPTPRAVYLDWLADRGDTRGKGGRSRGPMPELPGAARGLVAKPAWLGGLRDVAEPRDSRFVDGVLETLALRTLEQRPQGKVSDLRLATVRELKLAHRSAGRAVWTSGGLGSLTHVTGPSAELAALGEGGPQRKLERVRLIFTSVADWADGPQLRSMPRARQLMVGFAPATGAGYFTEPTQQPLQEELDGAFYGRPRPPAPRPFRLTPMFAQSLEPALREAVDRRHFDELGVEVADATLEGIASWLRFSAEREAVFSVVHAGSLFVLDAVKRHLRVGPYAQGKALERRLLVVSTILRELADLPIRSIEIDAPSKLPQFFKGVNLLLLECTRRGDVKDVKLGGRQVLP
jgi:uncharacterized protein (TIGR02996 family)